MFLAALEQKRPGWQGWRCACRSAVGLHAWRPSRARACCTPRPLAPPCIWHPTPSRLSLSPPLLQVRYYEVPEEELEQLRTDFRWALSRLRVGRRDARDASLATPCMAAAGWLFGAGPSCLLCPTRPSLSNVAFLCLLLQQERAAGHQDRARHL